MKQKRILSLALSMFMLVSTCMPATPIYAQNEISASEAGLCVHHTAHTEECGYTEAVEGQPCTHVHDENCGYVASVPEVPCDKGCVDIDDDGVIDHAVDCAYQAGVEGQPCTHVHDESCGYTESVAASPCTYAVNGCPYCVTAWSWVDPEGALAENDGNWGLGLPGVSEENPLTRDALAQLLPQAVSATTDDGQIRDLTLAWDLTAIPEEGAVSGDYTVTAALPDGYDLVEGVPALTVLLSLGGAVSLGNTPGVDTLAEVLPEEPSYIVVQKTITGLTTEQLETLKKSLQITVEGNNATYTLSYGENSDNILWREDGNTWAWRINGAAGGNYTVKETGCDMEGATLHATGTGSVNVAEANIGLEVIKETTCSHADWPLYDGKFFAGALTNGGIIVITSKSPSASQRQAIEKELVHGNWKRPVYYYSLDSLEPGQESYELSVQGRVLTYYPNEKYDSESKPGKIVFSSTSEWTHVAEVTYNTEAIKLADIQINNDYTQPVTLGGEENLAVSKTLTGREWKSTDSFTFTISAEGTNTPMPVSSTITISGSSAEKTAHFGDITYTAPGTYVYTIREDASTVPGVSSDTTVYKVIVTVTKDENGLLHTSVAYQKAKDGMYQSFTYDGSLPFTNTYSATSATSKLNGHKHLTGKTLSANQFKFYIESVTVDKGKVGEQKYTDYTTATNAGVPLPSLVTGFGEDYTVANGPSGSASDYDIYFGDLTFTHTQAGHTYTYTIREVQGNATGYSYDDQSKSVTYAVRLETEGDNTQSVVVDVTKDASSTDANVHGYFAFENRYKPLYCTAQPVVTKTLTGRDMLPDETFTFTLTANSRNPAGAALPGDTTATVSGAKDGVAETVTFDAITFTKAGTYQFYIQETGWNETSLPTDDTSGLTFDTRAISVIYTVTDVNGQLTVGAPVYGSGISAINNTYAATGTLVGATNLMISKTLVDTSDDPVDWEAYQFTFTLTAAGNAPLPAEGTTLILSKNKTSGNFGDIVYTQPGTYTYTILENYPGYAGIQRDDTVYTVRVTVTDNGDGTLAVSPIYTATKGSNTTSFTYSNTTGMPFVNVQDVTTASVALRGSKTLDGHALANNQFQFYIDSVTVTENGQNTVYGGASGNTFDAAKTAGVPLPNVGLGKNNAISNNSTAGIDFGSIIFDEHHIGKTYTYAIKEVQNNVNGYTCDEATKIVKVAVTDADSAPDKVVVQATVTRDASAPATGNDYFVFNNTYTATGTLGGSQYLKISKTLTGRPWQDTDKFTFTISADNGGPLPTTTSVEVNSNSQAAHFGDISYTQKDAGKTYTYTISETKGTIAGITYSKASYQVTVTVADNNDGTLAVNSDMKKLADDAGNTLVPSETVTDHTASFTNASDAKVTLFLKPADVITYMRGDQGYSGSVDDEGNADKDNTDMPKPMFYLTLNASSKDTVFQQKFQAELDKVNIADAVTIQATGTEGNERKWTIELAGQDENGQNLYYLSPALTGQDEVRVQYTDSWGNVFVEDQFTPVTKLNTSFDINLYTGKVAVNTVQVSIEGVNTGSAAYAGTPTGMDSTGTGTLTVCFVEEENGNPTTGMAAEITAPVASGNGAVTADKNTNYTLNKTTVPVDKDSVALLFDKVYDYGDGTTEMAKAFQARTDKALRALPAGWVRYYQAQYLDLVDVNNGNAWILADQPVTVYWGYPEGTDQNTQFSLVHYVSLERQTSYVTADVENWNNVEIVNIKNTENGICFTVDPDTDLSNFGPFVLVWEKSTVTPEPDDEEESAPTPAPTPKPTPAPAEEAQPVAAPVAAVIPQTGDDSQPLVWVALVVVSGAALAGLAVYRKKRSDK